MNDDFDSKLREKWDEKQFPVDDNHRQQMLALLDDQRRRKGGILWWYVAAGIAIIGIGLIGLFYTNKPNTSISPVIQIDTLNTDKTIPGVADNISKEEDLSSISSYKPNLSHENVNDQKNNLPTNLNSQTKSGNVSNPKSQHNISGKNVHVSTKNNIISLEKSVLNNAESAKEISPGNTTISLPSEIPETEISPESNKPLNAIEFNLIRNSYITSPIESEFYSEIEYSGPEVSKTIRHSFSNFHSLRLYAEMGAGYIPSVKNVYSSGWNLMAGAGLKYKLDAKTNLFVSAGYLMQSDGFTFERTSVVQHPGFGTRSNFNTLVPDKLHFIYNKAGIQYEMKRNLLSVFIGGQWLYGAQGNIVITSEDQFTGTNMQTSRYTWLKTNGMRHMLWNTELSYGYRITPRLCLQGGVKYYFSSIDIKDPALQQEGFYWKGHFSSLVPSFIINYHLYGKH